MAWTPPRSHVRTTPQRSSLVFRLALEPMADELVAGFDQWADGVASWAQSMGFIADAIRNHHARHLSKSGTPTGPRFARLKRSYKREKDKHWSGRPILTRTGALLSALSEKGAVGHLEHVTDSSVVVGIDPTASVVDTTKGKRRVMIAVYAMAHQTGYTIKATRRGKDKVRKAKGYRPEQRTRTYKTRDIVVPARPPVRADISNTPGSLGYVVRQILQVQIADARRAAFGLAQTDSASKMARLAKRKTR